MKSFYRLLTRFDESSPINIEKSFLSIGADIIAFQ
jgi:hypothetical protein